MNGYNQRNGTPSAASDRKIISINGLLVPVEWDDQGNVTGMAVYTFNEQEYRLIGRGMRGLLGHIRKRIMVQGFLVERKGRKYLRVQGYRPVESSAPEPGSPFGEPLSPAS
jgi:hypothetical protein